MIVTCEECTTQFQLDESRLPASGARVRCSRCKHTFFLAHPSTTPGEAIHSIAEESAAAASAVTPEPSSDLGSDLGGTTALPDPSASSAVDPDEEEWQFSEEVRIEGDEDLGTEDDFDADTDFGEGFDATALSSDIGEEAARPDDEASPGLEVEAQAAEEESSGLELDSDNTGIEAGHDESSFGSVDDFSSLMEDEEPKPDESVVANEAPAPGDEIGAKTNLAEAGVYSEKGVSDDLGDPESWNLVESEDLARPRGPIGNLVDSFSQPGSGAAGSLADQMLADGGVGYSADDELGEPSAFRKVLGGIGHGLGWVACVVLVASVGYVSLKPEWTRWAATDQRIEVGSFSAETIDSSWVETSRAGSVLLVEGEVRNTGGEAIWPTPIRVALLDGRGERLEKTNAIRVGDPLAEPVLRESTLEELAIASDRAHRSFMGRRLAPGEVRTFSGIVSELPENARRILLEVDSGADSGVDGTRPNPVADTAPPAALEEAQASGTVAEAAIAEVVGQEANAAVQDVTGSVVAGGAAESAVDESPGSPSRTPIGDQLQFDEPFDLSP